MTTTHDFGDGPGSPRIDAGQERARTREAERATLLGHVRTLKQRGIEVGIHDAQEERWEVRLNDPYRSSFIANNAISAASYLMGMSDGAWLASLSQDKPT